MTESEKEEFALLKIPHFVKRTEEHGSWGRFTYQCLPETLGLFVVTMVT